MSSQAALEIPWLKMHLVKGDGGEVEERWMEESGREVESGVGEMDGG